jgi:hypothetical protein
MKATTNPRKPHKALGPLTTDTLAGVIAAASSTGYEDWWGRVRSSGYCAHPIHLTRTHSGTTTTVYARCENRRESVCPACSDLYALDTWHIVTEGLTPERTADAAAVFVTLTAPSFGAVHAHRPAKAACTATSTRPCPHGTPTTCTLTHQPGDETLGSPLCAHCYEYDTHALTTWWFPELWKRYILTLRRLVTRHTPGVKISFVKVMEMQARVAPHYHAIIRTNQPGISAETLATLATLAATLTRLEVPHPDGTRVLRFGTQIDVQPLASGETSRRVAGYLAKYVTKNITAAPLPARIPATNIDTLPIPEHHRRIMHTLTRLAALGPDDYAGMTDRLGTLGWRGHTTTKSRTYSTTMTAQKTRRAAWRATHTPDTREHESAASEDPEWEYDKSGHRTSGHRYLNRPRFCAAPMRVPSPDGMGFRGQRSTQPRTRRAGCRRWSSAAVSRCTNRPIQW